MRYLLTTLVAFTGILCYGQSIKTEYSSIDSFKDALPKAKPGDTLLIKSGTYDDNSINIEDLHGTNELPIVIMAKTIGAVTLTGDTKFIIATSSHLIVQGFVFTNSGTAVKLEGSNNIRITRNDFNLNEESSTKWVYIGGVWDQPNSSFSHHNRIDHNIFQNKQQTGHYITIDGSGETKQSQFDLIDHNFFKNNGPRATNEKESIRIGWSEMSASSGYTFVEFNYFESCNGDPEIISVKSCDNVIRHNTISRSEGTISLRHGNRNRVEGNYIFGGDATCSTDSEGTYCSGGIRIYGEDHVIVNNYIEGVKGGRWDAPITLTEGDAESGNGSLSKHFRIERAIIAFNTLINNRHGIEIGFDNNGKYSKPPRDVIMAYNLVTSHTNELIKYHNEPESMTWLHNVMQPTGEAVLTTDENKSFADSEVSVTNPHLEYSETEKVWKPTASTPTYEVDTDLVGTIDEDVEGKSRGTSSSVGAINFSTESVRYAPLGPNDVGPESYHPDYDGEVEIAYVNVAKNRLEFDAKGGTELVRIESNSDWEISITDDAWLTSSSLTGHGNGDITLTALSNSGLTSRQSEINITNENIVHTLFVFQKGTIPEGVTKLNIVQITASSEQVGDGKDNNKNNVNDGDLSTLWAAEGEQHITLDLGSPMPVEFVKIAFGKGDTRNTYFEIQGSADGDDYTTLLSNGSSSGSTNDLEIFDIENMEARHIRLKGKGNNVNACNNISELEIWGIDTKAPLTPMSAYTSQEGVIIFPNPTSGYLYVKNSNDYDHFEITDLNGKILLSGPINNDQLDVRSLKSGIWILRLFSQNNQPRLIAFKTYQ